MFAYQQKPYLHIQNEALTISSQMSPHLLSKCLSEEKLGKTGWHHHTPQVFEGLLQVACWHKWHLETRTIKQSTFFLHKVFSYPSGHRNLPILRNIAVVGFALSDPISSLPNCVILHQTEITKVPEHRSWVTLVCNPWGTGVESSGLPWRIGNSVPSFSSGYIYTCFPVPSCS